MDSIKKSVVWMEAMIPWNPIDDWREFWASADSFSTLLSWMYKIDQFSTTGSGDSFPSDDGVFLQTGCEFLEYGVVFHTESVTSLDQCSISYLLFLPIMNKQEFLILYLFYKVLNLWDIRYARKVENRDKQEISSG